MKWIAPILVLIALLQYTSPNGHPIFFTRAQIVAISDPATCDDKAGSRIMTTMGSFCVRESLANAVNIFVTPGQ